MTQAERDELKRKAERLYRGWGPDTVAGEVASSALALIEENAELRALVLLAEAGEYHSRKLCREAGDSEGCEACAAIARVAGEVQ